MGRRLKPRFKMVLPVRLWGTDKYGKPFNIIGYTMDISTGGARLGGVGVELQLADVIAVQYKQQKARFRVTWVGAAGGPKNKQIGVEYLRGEKFIWIDLPSEDFLDSFSTPIAEPSTEPAATESTTASTEALMPPAVEENKTGKVDYLNRVADLLEKAIAQLHEAEKLMESAHVSEDVVDGFHDSVGHIRNSAWAVQQWLELQQDSKDVSVVAANLYSERVRFTSHLCGTLAERMPKVQTVVSEDNRQMLASALRLLGQHLDPSLDTNAIDSVAALAKIDRQIRETRLPLASVLQLIAEQVCSFIPATGAAIALHEGAEMVCHASYGLAPEIGVRFEPSEGLAGEAIATHRVMVCADTETDSRVDRDLCRNLNLRSCSIVPICSGDQVLGILEAFSTQAHAFSHDAVSLMQQVADFVSSLDPRLGLVSATFP